MEGLMSFLIYFFVLLVSAASVLFGLDLVTSPLPKTPNVPIGRSVHIEAKAPAAEAKREAKVEAQIEAKATQANDRALTPLYPTSPGAAKGQTETAGRAPQEQAALEPQTDQSTAAQRANDKTTAGSTPSARGETPPVPAQQPPVTINEAKAPTPAPAPQPVTNEAKAPPATAEPPAQPIARQASNACNIAACAGAYRSFRASDCTYQPLEGPRRLCTAGGVATTAAAANARAPKPKQASSRDELKQVEPVVRHQPLQIAPPAQRPTSGPEMSEVERIVRHMTRNEDADIPVQDADGRIIIVRKSYR